MVLVRQPAVRRSAASAYYSPRKRRLCRWADVGGRRVGSWRNLAQHSGRLAGLAGPHVRGGGKQDGIGNRNKDRCSAVKGDAQGEGVGARNGRRNDTQVETIAITGLDG